MEVTVMWKNGETMGVGNKQTEFSSKVISKLISSLSAFLNLFGYPQDIAMYTRIGNNRSS